MPPNSTTNRPPLVFDLGSHSIRCGFANTAAELPKLTIPSQVAYPRNNMSENNNNKGSSSTPTTTTTTVYCGLEAVRMKSVSAIKHPIRDGHIANSQDFRLLLQSVCDIFRNVLPDTPCVITEPLFVHKSFRQEVATLLFDLHRVPSVLFASQGLTSLFAVGELSGVILDVGEHSSRAIAAVDGIGIPSTYTSTSLGADTVNSQMIGVLQESGQSRAVEYSPQIKEALCEISPVPLYVAGGRSNNNNNNNKSTNNNNNNSNGSYNQSSSSSSGNNLREFSLPDSQFVRISSQDRFRCPEVLFANSFFGSSGAPYSGGGGGSSSSSIAQPLSVAQIVEVCLNNCDDIVRPHLLPRIHYCGGTTSMTGFENRLLNELRKPQQQNSGNNNNNNNNNSDSTTTPLLLSDSDRCMFSIPVGSSLKGCRVHPSDRTWAGASIFASLSSTSSLFTTQREFQEQGAGALGRFRQLAV